MPDAHDQDETRIADAVPGPALVAPLAGRTLGGPDASFVLAEWVDEGGPPGPPRLIAPLHVHHGDDEAWYVLSGRLRFRLGDRDLEAPAGSAVLGPRGMPHTFWNPGPGALPPDHDPQHAPPDRGAPCPDRSRSGGRACGLPPARLRSRAVGGWCGRRRVGNAAANAPVVACSNKGS